MSDTADPEATVRPTDFQSLPNFKFLSAADLPAEDWFSFSSLPSSNVSAWADACDEKYRQRISELETYIATVQFLRNTYTPAVSRLPNEILMRIFAQPSLTDHTLIRRVCRRWRSVLLATCPFWEKCISCNVFTGTPHHHSLLRAALKYSGALAISVKLLDPSSAIWDMLSEHHARIAELMVKEERRGTELSTRVGKLFRSGHMERLQTLFLQYNFSGPYAPELPRSGWDEVNLPTLRTLILRGSMPPSTAVASLVTVNLKYVYLTSAMLVSFVNRCPLLETLQLGIQTLTNERYDHGTVIENRAIGGLQLRKIDIHENTYEAARLLCLFRSIKPCTFIRVTCADDHRYPTASSIDFQQVFSEPPLMYRTCFEPVLRRQATTRLLVKVFIGSVERLRFSCYEEMFLHNTMRLLPPITVFIVNSGYRSGYHEECDECCVKALRLWDLPHLRRLEIPHASTSEAKHDLVVNFLNRFGHGRRASELSLAWVIHADGERRDAFTLQQELEDLLDVLRDHVNSGRPKLGRLELYAVAKEFEEWEPFTGSIDSGSDARLCSTIVEPFLAEFQRWVDVVHIG